MRREGLFLFRSSTPQSAVSPTCTQPLLVSVWAEDDVLSRRLLGKHRGGLVELLTTPIGTRRSEIDASYASSAPRGLYKSIRHVDPSTPVRRASYSRGWREAIGTALTLWRRSPTLTCPLSYAALPIATCSMRIPNEDAMSASGRECSFSPSVGGPRPLSFRLVSTTLFLIGPLACDTDSPEL